MQGAFLGIYKDVQFSCVLLLRTVNCCLLRERSDSEVVSALDRPRLARPPLLPTRIHTSVTRCPSDSGHTRCQEWRHDTLAVRAWENNPAGWTQVGWVWEDVLVYDYGGWRPTR